MGVSRPQVQVALHRTDRAEQSSSEQSSAGTALLSEARTRPRRSAGHPKVTVSGTRIGLSTGFCTAPTFVTREKKIMNKHLQSNVNDLC